MSDLLENIPECVAGGESLLSAEYANKLIRAVNALKNLAVNPTQNIAFVIHTKSQMVLDLSKADERLSALESQVTSTPSSGNTNANTSLSGNVSQLQNFSANAALDIINAQDDIRDLEDRVNNITITANGTCANGVITINISASM